MEGFVAVEKERPQVEDTKKAAEKKDRNEKPGFGPSRQSARRVHLATNSSIIISKDKKGDFDMR